MPWTWPLRPRRTKRPESERVIWRGSGGYGPNTPAVVPAQRRTSSAELPGLATPTPRPITHISVVSPSGHQEIPGVAPDAIVDEEPRPSPKTPTAKTRPVGPEFTDDTPGPTLAQLVPYIPAAQQLASTEAGNHVLHRFLEFVRTNDVSSVVVGYGVRTVRPAPLDVIKEWGGLLHETAALLNLDGTNEAESAAQAALPAAALILRMTFEDTQPGVNQLALNGITAHTGYLERPAAQSIHKDELT